MAGKRIVIPNYMPALDINGNPQAGAKITFYDNETTTLKAIYTSADLSVAHPNPISANAAGIFPSIFADEDEVFTVAITDADDDPISGLRNKDDVRPSEVYGADSAAAELAQAGAEAALAEILAIEASGDQAAAIATKAGKSANLSDLTNAATARTNIGAAGTAALAANGGAALLGTSGGVTVQAALDARVTTAALAATTGAALVNTTSGVTVQAALDNLVGRLSTVTRNGPLPGRYTAPTGMNNPLGVWVDCDGRTYAFNKRPYVLADWSQDPTITGITNIYVDYDLGNNANAGTSAGSGNAWKTFDKAIADAPDKSIIHLMNPRVGYLSSTNGGHTLGTRRIKVIGDHADGPTLFYGWRETYTAAFMSWVASGSAFTSTAAANLSTIQAMADDNYRDRYGLPLAMPHVASAATCLATPGSWNWDGTTLTVHMIDARTPDPADGWIPITSFSNMSFISDGDIAFENITCAFNGGAADVQGLRFRPVTTGAANTIKVALKNVRAFGASGNAFQIYDAKTIALQECYGSHCHYDIFNYASFISTGDLAEWVTIYEDNCYGHDAGYLWRQYPVVSDSNNLTTAHRGMHIWRVNSGGHNIPNSFLADVNGCFSLNFGIAPTQSQSGGLFQNNYWYQKLSGEGSTGAKMMLIGCYGDAVSANKYHFSNWDDGETVASLGEIHIADWQGPVTPKLRTGTLIYDYRTGTAL